MAHITITQLNTILSRIVTWVTGKFAAKNVTSGKLEYSDMPVVVLASMGHELDGTDNDISVSVGDTYFLPAGSGTTPRIMYRPDSGNPVRISDPASGVIYCNAYTGLLYRWDASQAKMVSVGGTSGGSIDVSGKADMLAGTNMLTPSQWPKVVLRNVTDETVDDLASGDVYFDSGHLWLYRGGNQTPVDLNTPSNKTIYFCLADGKMYRWVSSSFQPVLSAVASSGSYNDLSNKPSIPEKISDLTDDSGFLDDEAVDNAIDTALSNYYDKSTINSTFATKLQVEQDLERKQDTLTFDNAPTAGSNNPVKSSGIKTALDAKADAATTYSKTEVDDAIDDKLTEVAVTEISDAADIIVIDDADLAFIDEDGNIAMQVREGHVETQNFDSRQVATNSAAISQLQSQIGQASQPVQTDVLVKQDDDAAFDISDVNGNVIMRINNKGHISTKGFDSENMDIFRATKLDSPQCVCHGYGSVSSVQADTIAYFRAGYTAGYRFFECDAINCSDGVPVCTHDNVNGLTVYDKTTHEATTVSIASVSGTRTIQMTSTELVEGYTWDSAGNVPIALLSDVIWQVCYFYRCPLHIDGQGLNKASRYAASQYAETLGVGQYVFHELQSGAYTDWDIPCNAIVAAGTVASMVEKANAYKKADNNIIFYLSSSTAVSSVKAYASAAHAVGCYLLSWTFTSAADARAWFAEGADFLITSNSITNNKI